MDMDATLARGKKVSKVNTKKRLRQRAAAM